MERRLLGKTGEKLSIIGFGGIVVSQVAQADANRAVALAIDRGINYFDVAPSYGDAEERLGPALVPYRDRVFLACKTAKRGRDEALAELHQSLRRLETDHIDLYQLHAMTTDADFEQAMGPGGAIEALCAAREQGLVRYLGFSAHSVEVALRLLDAFAFDTILFPVNWVNYFNAGFGPQVIEKACQKGVGCLALKAMARTRLAQGESRPYPKCWYEPIDNPEEAALALRFTLTEPVTAALPPGDGRLFELALDIARNFKPLSEAERAALRQRAGGIAPLFELAS